MSGDPGGPESFVGVLRGHSDSWIVAIVGLDHGTSAPWCSSPSIIAATSEYEQDLS